MTLGPPDEFGYRTIEGVRLADGVDILTAVHPQTLRPLVVLRYLDEDDIELGTFGLLIENADAFYEDLGLAIERARANQWDGPSA